MTYRKLSLRPLNAMLKQALHSRAFKRTALGAGALAPAFALANPTGGQVVGGSASISVPDANHTIINQASQSAILNWQQFSIGSNQYVQFIQPDSSSVVLNRVIGGNPSQILGNLSANGQVFLVNPNGVFFGQTATLDVQGLIATTLDIKDSDFLAGHYTFSKGSTAPDASVVNQGNISANGGYVVLAGDYAENDGVIAAQAGTVVLASGNQMALTLNNNALVSFVVDQATLAQYAGVNNVGTITADGGTVLMTAKVANALTATAVNNSGLITAHSIQDHNGVIILAAQGGDINESGTLDASATQSGVTGGAVVIRGDHHTDIASTASINAAGDNANGGFVELSGHHLSVRGNVNVGNGGNLLIDPMKLYITSGGASHGSWTSGDWVTTTFIDTQLNAGVSLTLVASNSVTAAIPPGDAGAAAAANITGTNANGNLTIKTGSLQIHSNSTGGSLVGSYCGQGVCTPYVSGPTAYAFTPTNGTISLSG
ncbi:MAG TPA: filamentous hemagglutinin N-terminal domain-containing protein, partial [Gammaproteobacteria bacterium]